jgi:FMN-dependent oxidoreductase (nitrilotriacetate monooxygenase family)
MSSDPRQLNLNLFIYPNGHHEAAWRYRGSEPKRVLDIKFYQDMVRRAEAQKFDAVFFADALALPDNIKYASRFRIEPLTWVAGLAAVTEKIGFIATASTTYYDPFNLARLFASLDHLSQGRIGWNIVTTSIDYAAQNYSMDAHPDHADRYERAHEFVDVATRLWDSWEDEALINDPASGIFADPDKIHEINHAGKHFRVRGPLNVPRTPQGRPVYVQAGSSPDGRAFAATHAEAIFTAHQTLESAQEFYTDIKKRAAALGRHPDQIRVLPGISPFIASTEAEAQALHYEFNELTQAEYSLLNLKYHLDVDLTGFDLDAPFPRHLVALTGDRAERSRSQVILGIIDREKPTIRQLMHKLAGARGHWVVAGTPEQVADKIELWFMQGAADGFNVMPPHLPGGFDIFAEEVVPILRKRGLFRTEYSGSTLRDHFGLSRPRSLYSQADDAAQDAAQ